MPKRRTPAPTAPSAPPSAAPASPLLRVTARGTGLPFSKGVLAQSLLAAALEPSQAFSIAQRIEHEVASSGGSEISRDDLRALVQRVLREDAGEEAAQRYLLWRRHQEPERPLVLLIGGTSGVGKSAIALEVARRLGIGRVLSTDSIRQVMRALLSRELVPAIHGSSYDAFRLLPQQDGVRPDVIAGFRAQASAVSIGVSASLERTVAESSHLVIDGVSIAPGLIDLEPYADRADVVFLVIAVAADDLCNRFVTRSTGQPRRLADRYLANLEGILAIQDHLVERAQRSGVPVIENAAFDECVRHVIEHVMARLGARTSREQGGTG